MYNCAMSHIVTQTHFHSGLGEQIRNRSRAMIVGWGSLLPMRRNWDWFQAPLGEMLDRFSMRPPHKNIQAMMSEQAIDQIVRQLHV